MDDELDPLKRPRHPAREAQADQPPTPAEPAAPLPSQDGEPGQGQGPAPRPADSATPLGEPRRPRFVPVTAPQRSPWRWGIAAGVATAGVLVGAAWLVIDINRHSAMLETMARDVQQPLNAPRTVTEADAMPRAAANPPAAEAAPATEPAPAAARPPVKRAGAVAPGKPAPPAKPAAMANPQTACEHRTPFWTAVCLQSRCATDTYRAHATCVQLRRSEEQRRLDRELGG